jgi:hypothetical protein
VDHCFQMEGLGKEVREGDGLDRVAGGDEGAQIACERCGVAGDVDQRGCRDLGEERGDLRARPVRGGSTTIRSGCSSLGVPRRKSRVVARTVAPVVSLRLCSRAFHGGWGGFDGDDAGKAGRELAGEEADAGEEVPGQGSTLAGSHLVDERIDEPAVDLEERAVVDAIIEAGGWVGNGSCAPFGESTRRMTGAAAGGEFRALESGDAFAKSLGKRVEPGFHGIGGGFGGEEGDEEGGFFWVAEEGELGGAEIFWNALKRLRGGLSGG